MGICEMKICSKPINFPENDFAKLVLGQKKLILFYSSKYSKIMGNVTPNYFMFVVKILKKFSQPLGFSSRLCDQNIF